MILSCHTRFKNKIFIRLDSKCPTQRYASKFITIIEHDTVTYCKIGSDRRFLRHSFLGLIVFGVNAKPARNVSVSGFRSKSEAICMIPPMYLESARLYIICNATVCPARLLKTIVSHNFYDEKLVRSCNFLAFVVSKINRAYIAFICCVLSRVAYLFLNCH